MFYCDPSIEFKTINQKQQKFSGIALAWKKESNTHLGAPPESSFRVWDVELQRCTFSPRQQQTQLESSVETEKK